MRYTLVLKLEIEHKKVFQNAPTVGFKRDKCLKDIPWRTRVTPIEEKTEYCRSYKGTKCEMCNYVVATEIFRFSSAQKE